MATDMLQQESPNVESSLSFANLLVFLHTCYGMANRFDG
jgi:hypothetical protein